MGLESGGVSLGCTGRKGEDRREAMWKLRRWSLCVVCGTAALKNIIFSTPQTKITHFLRMEFVLESADARRQDAVCLCLPVRPGAQRRENPRHRGRVPDSRGLRHRDGVRVLVCVCVHTHMRVCTCVRMRAHVCACVCTCVCACACMCVCTSHSVVSDSLQLLDCSQQGSSVQGILQARILE